MPIGSAYPQAGGQNKQGRQSGSQGQNQSNKNGIPLLVHFDVNKTVIQSDSIQMKGIEDGIREGIAELFWGFTKDVGGKLVWEWTKSKPSCYPPVDEADDDSRPLVNYFEYCRKVVKDKSDRKDIISSFKLVSEEARTEMDRLLQVTLKKMQLAPDIRYSKSAEEAGLKGSTISMFPTLFHFVAALQRSKRIFAILFRSMGADHETIKAEWNAFCEMRHPVYSKFLEGVGPLDGSVQGVPDRRIHSLHTMYRDSDGPTLILNTFTNGPNDKSWDSWAKTKPKPKADTRNGRDYIKNVLHAESVDGFPAIQQWMKDHIFGQGTAAIKDDWAWWQWHGEQAHAGKLLTLIGGSEETEQLFFDDNIDIKNTRIVDCRDERGNSVPGEASINKMCTKVNPVEALLDDGYFLRKLQACHGEHLDLGASLIDFQRQLTEVEDQKSVLQKQVKNFKQQLKTLTEENRRMKLLHRINVKNVDHLRELLSKHFDLDSFGKTGFRTVTDLFWEIENGHCWLEPDEKGKITRCFEMVFLKILYKGPKASEDLILIESHEQGSDGRVQSRNYLPGVRKALQDQNYQAALDRWLERGLGADLTNIAQPETMPSFTPDAPDQQTTQTQAFPIPCCVQQSEATYTISNKAVTTHKEHLAKVGLSGGTSKHFTFADTEAIGGSVTRFFRWDKLATWEASTAATNKQKSNEIDIAVVCDKLFRGHARKEVYENLLLQMFEIFTAKTLCGGFSGSVVIRVQPFESDGRPGEPCIVKLDKGEAIREEFVNSQNVFKALPDRAARILGDAAYATNKKGEEFGAMRLELAGACWNVPELAQGSANLLVTFKDLLLYESDSALGGGNETAGDIRPFGNVNSVLAETFGPGGVVASLRNGGSGLRRHTKKPILWGKNGDSPWYTLRGKKGKFNPYFANGEYPPEQQMRFLYKECFGQDMPDVTNLVEKQIKPMLEDLASKAGPELFPLVALAHGDLNAANIMIDALDAVWLIDFATSVDLPLFTDMCKFEMACLFEYSTIPITPAVLLNFASADKELWTQMNVGVWLRVPPDIGESFMREVAEWGLERLSMISQKELQEMIEKVVRESGKAPHKQREFVRSLSAKLTASEENMHCAFKYAASVSKTLLQGDYVLETLNVKEKPPLPESGGQKGALSLKMFMEIAVQVRRYVQNDIAGVIREYASTASSGTEGVQTCDALSLSMWLPILRESYRLIGYPDIPPQQKIWSIFHCSVVAGNVLRMLATLSQQWHDLGSLQVMNSLRNDLANQQINKSTSGHDLFVRDVFSEADSHWFYSHTESLPPASAKMDKILRKMHSTCPFYGDQPGYFAPIFQALDVDGRALPLSFHSSPNSKTSLPLRICEDHDGHDSSDDSKPPWDPAIIESVGGVDGNGKAVTLKSRLFFCTPSFVRLVADLDGNETEDRILDDSFSIADWSERLFTTEALTPDKSTPTKLGSGNFGRTMSDKGVVGVKNNFRKFMTLEAVAYHGDGTPVHVKLILGMPTLCYPAGMKLCIDISVVEQQRSASPEVVIMQLTDQGLYRVRDAENPTSDSERDFGPSCCNHVYLTPTKYKKGQRILFNKDNNWVDCELAEPASAEIGYRCRLNMMMPVAVPDHSGAIDKSDSKQMAVAPSEKVSRHTSRMNSGAALLPASTYEEEVNRIKTYFRARHSFIIDALCGERLGVKMCAVPTLHLMGREVDSISRTTSMVSLNSTKSLSRKTSFAQGSDFGGASEVRHGWSMMSAAFERFEKGEPSCSPSAFLVFGSPGSGKSCLLCRLIMDCLEKHQNLVPMILAVTDMVKRSDVDAENIDCVSSAVSAWFDKYLTISYGEDSSRYKMMRQAIAMHRVVFLFEGLEDGGALTPIIEKLIRDIVMEGHLVVVTSRPLIKGTSTLEGAGIVTMELKNLTDEQQRSIAHARLGLSGLNAMNQFLTNLRARQAVPGGEEEAEQENVFSNPMMLSMLLCYLQMKIKEQAERGEAADNTVTITDVYRVAVNVMLNRVQSKQQADRHNKDAKVEECNRILEKMAMTMQVQRTSSLCVATFDNELRNSAPELITTWESLKSAVVAGHAVFLRVTNDGDKMHMHFLVKGFQDFFAASEIAHDGGIRLPGLAPLLQEPWWGAMLEMLAEYRANRYVKLIEGKVESYTPDKGNTFLHLAADVGHRPVFQHLQLFSDSTQHYLSTSNSEKQMPLHVAAGRGNLHVCGLMLQHKAQIDAEDAGERLPMHVALQQRQFHCAKFLLDRYMERKDHTLGIRNAGSQRRSRDAKDNPAERLAARVMCTNGEPPLTEEEFKGMVDESFPELRFFGKSDTGPQKQAYGALLSVFWIVSDRYDQFVSEQKPENRLTKESWMQIQEWTRDTVHLLTPAKVGAMLVFVTINYLGKIQAMREAFTQGITDPSDAIRTILHSTAVVIPSFSKLEPPLQQTILITLQTNFNVGQFLQTESLPGDLSALKDILGSESDGHDARNILGFLLFKTFALMSGLFGPRSLGGSLFMVQKQYLLLSLGLRVLQYCTTESATRVYDRFLEARAETAGINFDPQSKPSRAIARLVCLSRVFDEKDKKDVIVQAFNALEPDVKKSLADFLNADGMTQKGFLLYNAPLFLVPSRENEKVGLVRALRLLLTVFEKASAEFAESRCKVITLYFTELENHAKDCQDSEIFEFTKLDIVRNAGHLNESQGSVKLSPWQLRNDTSMLEKLQDEGGQLVSDTMSQLLREANFVKRLAQVFPELKFFAASESDATIKAFKAQTLGTLLASYWMASDHCEAFTRGQAMERKLSTKSWRELMEMQNLTQGQDQHEILNCIFVAGVLHALGKIPKFKEQLAPHCGNHREVLAHVMDTCPKVLPSYMRLSPPYRELVRECVTQQFTYEQFMVAEALPGNLTPMKRMLHEAKRKELPECFLHVYLRTAFSELAGSLGNESLEGSMYMTEDMFMKFQMGMEALKQLEASSGEPGAETAAYDYLLRTRAGAESLEDPDSRDSRATMRLACLAEVADDLDFTRIKMTLKEFEAEERAALYSFLNQDGLSQDSPGFVLVGTTNFLRIARPKVGLAAALRMLLRIYKAAATEFAGCRRAIVEVHLHRLAAVTGEYAQAEPFQELPFELQRVNGGEAIVVPPVFSVEEPSKPLEEPTSPCPTSPKPADAKPSPDSVVTPKAPIDAPGEHGPQKKSVENGTPLADVSDKRLAQMMEELAVMRKAHDDQKEETAKLLQANTDLRKQNLAYQEQQTRASQESARLQSLSDNFRVEAVRLKQENQELRETMNRQAQGQQMALSRVATESANVMAADAEQAQLQLRAECREFMEREGQYREREQKHEAEAWQLRSELASAESGLNGLTMEIGELTMELAKLRSQAANDARLQRTSSEARIELLELRRQLLGRDTMLGHEREVADKRLDAARRDVSLMNERMDLAIRERDWAMQELHAARSDERLALSRSRTLADEGSGLRSRCDALEAAKRSMQWELEVLRTGGAPPPVTAVLGQSATSQSPAQSASPSLLIANGNVSSPEAASPTASSFFNRNVGGSASSATLNGGASGSRLLRKGVGGPPRTGASSPEKWAQIPATRMPPRQNSAPAFEPPVRGAFGVLQSHLTVPPPTVTPLGAAAARTGSRTPRANSPVGAPPPVGGLVGSFTASSNGLGATLEAQRAFGNSNVPVVRRLVSHSSTGILPQCVDRQEVLSTGALSPNARRTPPMRGETSPSRPDVRWS